MSGVLWSLVREMFVNVGLKLNSPDTQLMPKSVLLSLMNLNINFVVIELIH